MKELDKLRLIMKSLRHPENGCPWDREQTIDSIKGYTIEEAYEVVDAIERKDMHGLRDELGDLLFHIIFYAEMADEDGHFNFNDVIEQLVMKLERRHPHVFSGMKLENSEQVKQQWEQIKQKERDQVRPDSTNLLDDISKHIPAIQRACKLQKRAAGVGFDWVDSMQILDKLDEELDELREEIIKNTDAEKISGELGDFMFCCINLARHFQIDPEIALRKTNEKFIQRFNYIEQELKNKNKSLVDATLDEMDALWDEAKKKKLI